MSETIALHFNIIHDDELTARLRDLGNRLVQHLPPSKMNFRFYFIDLPEVNAFSIAGGRVYVSRKLIAFSHSDDEVAGVLAHELGHIVTHQSAIEMTRAFRETMGVTQVGNREDIFRRFHQLVENAAHRRAKRSNEERHQLVADQIAIFALGRAGFSPQTFVDFWDRFEELHGKTGNWLSDLFGGTTPEQHRLRDMVKSAAALPPGCAERSTALDEASFKSWQSEVVEYSETRSESLPGLISKHRLTDRLRPDINNLRFSPDGRYILAQDDGGINIASRNPFTFLFYIPAPDANQAQFSPDSRFVSFVTSGLRVESWNIADEKRQSVHEITLREACLQTELAPDGATLACLSSQRALLLVNVVDSSIIFQKKDFYVPSFAEAFAFLLRAIASAGGRDDNAEEPLRFINIGFSPNGQYLLVAHVTPNIGMMAGTSSIVLFNLIHRSEEPVAHSIKSALQLGFAFAGADRIVCINPGAPQKSPVFKFPTGEKLDEVSLGDGLRLRGATHGNYLLIGPLKNYPLGILDLTTKQMNIVMKKKAADMYDGVFVTERMNGELALNTKENKTPLGLLQLPESNLGGLKTAAVSPDLTYLAISTRTRGAVWNLAKDSRLLYTRNFNGGGFDGLSFYADYPKLDPSPRQLAHFSLESNNVTANDIKEALSDQHGLYFVKTRPRNKNQPPWSDADVDVEDVRTSQMLWSRYFHSQIPDISFNPTAGTALFRWRFSEQGVEDEVHRIPSFKPHAEKDDYFCEVIDANVGGLIAYFTVKTNRGSLHFRGGSATTKWAVMDAIGDQILTYSLPKGEETGHFFGSQPTISASGLLAVRSESREIILYDLATSLQSQQYSFARPVAFKVFSEDGKRLLVLTNDQTVYLLDTTASPTVRETVASGEQK